MRTLVLSFALLAVTGCIHTRNGSKAPPFVQATSYNAVLAETNHGIADGVIDAQSAGLINMAQAADITSAQYSIAEYDKELSKLLALGPEAVKGQSEYVKNLLTQMKTSALTLSSSPSAGFKNPKSQQTFGKDASVVATTVDEIVGVLQAAGVLQ